jgi:hypothetical protein
VESSILGTSASVLSRKGSVQLESRNVVDPTRNRKKNQRLTDIEAVILVGMGADAA